MLAQDVRRQARSLHGWLLCAAAVVLLVGAAACDSLNPSGSTNTAATAAETSTSAEASSSAPGSSGTAALPSTVMRPRPSNVPTAAPSSSTALPATSAALPAPPDDHALTEADKQVKTRARTHFSLASDLLALTVNERAMLIGLRGKPKIRKLAPNKAVVDVAISTNSKRVALWMVDGSVEIYNTADGSALKTLPVAKAPANMDAPVMRWSGDDNWLAVADQERVHVWNVAEGKHRHSFEAWGVYTLGFGYDGHRLVGTDTALVWVWDPYTGRQLDERMMRTGGTFSTTVSPDGNFVASAEEDGHGATFYDTRPWQLRSVLVSETTCDAHISVGFSRDSKTILVAGGHKWLRAYRTKSAKPFASWQAPDEASRSSMSDNGKYVLATLQGDKAAAYEVASAKRTHTFEGMKAGRWLLSPDGRFAVWHSQDRVRIWAMMDGGKMLDATLDE